MSTLTLQNLQGTYPANKITVPTGHTLYAPGHVIQVKQTAKTDRWSAAPSTGVYSEVTGLSVSITPLLTSSKILVMVNAYVGRSNYQVKGLVKRNGTTVAVGDADGSKPRASFHVNGYAGGSSDPYQLLPTGFTYLDSPSTTSACSYTVELSGYSGSTVYVNRSHIFQEGANDYDALPVSTITAMEIAQ
jgi:hypothetical protein